MKKGIIFVIIILGMLGWAVYEFASTPKEASEQVDKNSTEVEEIAEADEDTEERVVGLDQTNYAPDFELTTLDGEQVKLSDFKGKKVMLNFWATWCPPCRAEMPDLEKLSKEQDIVVLAVNATTSEESVKNVEQFVEEYGLTFPVALDEEGEAGLKYIVQPLPTSYMIDGEGRIQNKAIGPLNYELMVQVFDMID